MERPGVPLTIQLWLKLLRIMRNPRNIILPPAAGDQAGQNEE